MAKKGVIEKMEQSRLLTIKFCGLIMISSFSGGSNPSAMGRNHCRFYKKLYKLLIFC